MWKSEVRDGMRIEWDVDIPMDDGIAMRADIFRPDDDGQYPVIMSYGPYAKGLAFEEIYKDQWDRMVAAYPDVAGDKGLLRLHRMGRGPTVVDRKGGPQRHQLLGHQPVARRLAATAVARGDVRLGRRGRVVPGHDLPRRNTLDQLRTQRSSLMRWAPV